MALALMFIDNNDNTMLLPQLDQQDILKQSKPTITKGHGKLKIKNFKFHIKKDNEQ
ncbi:RhoGAP domain containing protein [Entamoeba histolytica HM-3:IMSS]|nr:RhoGAP domain containing protein [Entamoeba histolytica HM-3:IMSS]